MLKRCDCAFFQKMKSKRSIAVDERTLFVFNTHIGCSPTTTTGAPNMNRITIHSTSWISVDGKPTGYAVAQRQFGTELVKGRGIDAPTRSLGALPQQRYALSHAAPASGVAGSSRFEADFLAAWDAAA
jgi:hypothetical protein